MLTFVFVSSQWSNVSCITVVDYYTELFMITTAPIALLLFMALVYLGPYYYQTSHPRPLELPVGEWQRRLRGRSRRRGKLLKLVLFTMFAIYPTEASRILNMFVCKQVEGSYYLIQDFNVKCYDARWQRFVAPNVICILIYPIGIPVYFAYLLFNNRKTLGDMRTRMRIGFLYDGYATHVWWFELVRRFVLMRAHLFLLSPGMSARCSCSAGHVPQTDAHLCRGILPANHSDSGQFASLFLALASSKLHL